jgi:glycine/sarcosine N-methyltransferase
MTMKWWILDSTEFYAKVLDYMQGVDPAWAEEWLAPDPDEQETLRAILSEGRGRTVLDCSCGSGGQTIPLARLGWRVTGTDFSAAQLELAQQRTAEEGLEVAYHVCDMRDLGQRFEPAFDWVVSCYALDNITEDAGIRQALAGMYGVLKPGGRCYIRLRDFDYVVEEKPRYEFKGERRLPHGRVIRMVDWEYESETHVVCNYVFWREDERAKETIWTKGWDVHVYGWRRRALRSAELEAMLRQAGFAEVTTLPKENGWEPYHVVASKGR